MARPNRPMTLPPDDAPARVRRKPTPSNVKMIGWGVWGGLMFAGFCFGVYAGTPKYVPPAKPAETAAVTPPATPEKPAPKPTPNPTPAPAPKPDVVAKLPPTAAEPKPVEPPQPEPPKPEPKAVEPPAEVMTPEPKKTEPPPEPKKPEPKKPEPKKAEPSLAAVAKVSFKDQIVPIFRAKCLSCHNSTKPKYGLDLSTVASILKGGNGGAVLKPGNPKDSTLYTSVEEDAMPKDPPYLTDAEKKLLKDWIAGGGK